MLIHVEKMLFWCSRSKMFFELFFHFFTIFMAFLHFPCTTVNNKLPLVSTGKISIYTKLPIFAQILQNIFSQLNHWRNTSSMSKHFERDFRAFSYSCVFKHSEAKQLISKNVSLNFSILTNFIHGFFSKVIGLASSTSPLFSPLLFNESISLTIFILSYKYFLST